MQIGISTASLFSRELTEDCFNVIHRLKIPLCEVFLSTLSEYEEDFVKKLADRKGDTRVYSIHTLTQQYEPELFNIMPRTRADCEVIFRKTARAAKILGADYYVFHGPAKFKKIPYVFDYPKLGKRIEELRAILSEETCGRADICYENVHWAYFNNPDYFINLKPYTNVKTCLDVKQAHQSGFDVYEYISCMGNRLTNIHLCDYNEQGATTLPGKGIFDFTKLFSALIEKGYDGAAMIEVYASDYYGYDDLARCYDYLTECLFKAKNNKGV
jgi:sugar phosphate isomerase/epimerase